MIFSTILVFVSGTYFVSTLAFILAFHRGKRNQALQEPKSLRTDCAKEGRIGAGFHGASGFH